VLSSSADRARVHDDASQLARAADYIAAISPEIPWHVTAFHKDYR